MNKPSRAERKAKAKDKKVEKHLEWLEDLKALIASGKTYNEACVVVANKVALEVENNPQNKAMLINAWVDLHTRLKTEFKKEREANDAHKRNTDNL